MVKLLGLLVSSLFFLYEMIISIIGRELFTFNANMGGDDEEAEDIEIEKEVRFFHLHFASFYFIVIFIAGSRSRRESSRNRCEYV